MSASLVGSEMCIRDSLGGIPGDRARVDGGEPRAAWDPAAAEQRGLVGHCLLYTSDAADDM
eukprot:1557706-Alexandrium_andersonii.AAC.1